MKFYESGNTSAAITYFLQADDSKRTCRVIDVIVKEYLEASLKMQNIDK